MQSINYAPINGCAVRVDIKNRKENADATHFRFQNFSFLHFDDIGDFAVRRSYHNMRIWRGVSLRVTERKRMCIELEKTKERKPSRKKQTDERDKKKHPKNPARLG